jgi:hypothetical protein
MRVFAAFLPISTHFLTVNTYSVWRCGVRVSRIPFRVERYFELHKEKTLWLPGSCVMMNRSAGSYSKLEVGSWGYYWSAGVSDERATIMVSREYHKFLTPCGLVGRVRRVRVWVWISDPRTYKTSPRTPKSDEN